MDKNLLQRYNVLQKKLEDLEHVHLDGKKLHQAETERLKLDLSRCQKTVAEQSDRINKLKKHNDALESRIQDLKQATISDQSEIKTLKTKLKSADLASNTARDNLRERDKRIANFEAQFTGTQSKLHDDLRDRDLRITVLENSLESEIKKRESLQISNQDLLAARNTAKQAEVNVQQELSNALDSFTQEREDFITRLENYKSLLSHTANQYGKLVATTIPSSTHNELKRLYHAAQFKALRLERKLDNTENQVQELANLIRQVNDRNDLLQSHLADINNHLTIYEAMLSESPPTNPTFDTPVPEPVRFTDDQNLESSEARLHELLATYYNLYSQQLAFAYTCVDKDLTHTTSLAKQHSQDLASTLASHKTITSNLEAAQQEHSTISEELLTLKAAHTALQRNHTSLESQITSLKDEQQQLILSHQTEIKKDRDTVQRLTSAAQKSRMAEDALRAEIDRLLTELAEAERYQETYTALSEQINSLLARNQLAEEEAERLSKFNVEILGHNNPAQRISYVDRIRRELAEARHRIIVLTREQENIVELNTDLQHELDMYKSVAEKQKTHITRVSRVPLSNVTRGLNNMKPAKSVKLDPILGEMTLDEIM